MATYISILVLLEFPSFHFKTSIFFYLGPVDSFLIFFFFLLLILKGKSYIFMNFSSSSLLVVTRTCLSDSSDRAPTLVG